MISNVWKKKYEGFESIIDLEEDVGDAISQVIPYMGEWQGTLIVTIEYRED